VRDGAAVRGVDRVAEVEQGSEETSHEASATPASIRQ
jgi:hypothetical protein